MLCGPSWSGWSSEQCTVGCTVQFAGCGGGGECTRPGMPFVAFDRASGCEFSLSLWLNNCASALHMLGGGCCCCYFSVTRESTKIGEFPLQPDASESRASLGVCAHHHRLCFCSDDYCDETGPGFIITHLHQCVNW